MNILHIDSSILGDYSVSRKVSAAVANQIRDSIPNAVHTYRDIAAIPIPHLSGAYLAALQKPDVLQSPAVQADIALSAEVLAEFLAADIVVIGAGLYNFGIPSQLKAWIDRILVAGKTFRYTAEGKPEGLVGKKRIILAIARGGIYSGESPAAGFEHTETYLRTAFGFIGLESEVVVAEGVAIGPDQRAAAIKNAEAQIAAMAF
jgi:FMN-dependent NADH-azoreductase